MSVGAKSKPKNVDAYIAGCRPEVRALLEQLRTTVQKSAPAATEAIKYGIPTFVLHENLVHFAACARHIGFYPSPSGIAAFKKELAGYKSAKGSVQFPLDEPMPLALIAKIVKFRVKEVARPNASRPDGPAPRRRK